MEDVVVHDMIERIYFYSIIFSQKEMGSGKHTADVVVPADGLVLPAERVDAMKVSLRMGVVLVGRREKLGLTLSLAEASFSTACLQRKGDVVWISGFVGSDSYRRTSGIVNVEKRGR
jgi:hypothetical protein